MADDLYSSEVYIHKMLPKVLISINDDQSSIFKLAPPAH